MADLTSGATLPLPTSGDIERAERFTSERFVHPGEERGDALAPGTARRRALDAALAELDEGLTAPSVSWRRRCSLLLGLERVLSEDEPRLADGTLLSAHQVDALSGTLTALMAAVQGSNGAGPATPPEPPHPARASAPGCPPRAGRGSTWRTRGRRRRRRSRWTGRRSRRGRTR